MHEERPHGKRGVKLGRRTKRPPVTSVETLKDAAAHEEQSTAEDLIAQIPAPDESENFGTPEDRTSSPFIEQKEMPLAVSAQAPVDEDPVFHRGDDYEATLEDILAREAAQAMDGSVYDENASRSTKRARG